jgi:hypothetical protein
MNINFIVFGLTRLSTPLEVSTLIITPPMWLDLRKSSLKKIIGRSEEFPIMGSYNSDGGIIQFREQIIYIRVLFLLHNK